jgi:hypothetical protein
MEYNVLLERIRNLSAPSLSAAIDNTHTKHAGSDPQHLSADLAGGDL